jgi:hypothetical protein
MRDQTTAGAALHDATTRGTISSSATLISQRILTCALQYPTAAGNGFFSQYPDQSSPNTAETLVCPGSNTALWGGADGVFFPASVNGWTTWTYNNSASGVWIETTTNAQNTTLIDAIVTKIGAAASKPNATTLRVVIRNP